MSTTLHSFMDIFETEFMNGEEKVTLKKISIPLIQRDYAQGRQDGDASRVRSRFLDALHGAILGTPITLDFVYGDIDDQGTMTPLDGQQRLTTLFLLHWYGATKENLPRDQYTFLKKFSYETRYSARYFCTELVDFVPSFHGTLSEEIMDQAWFPLEWKKDPTISSMLVMIDAIDQRFKDVPDIWGRLENRAITFYFLPIKDMGLTDELYIKMNSRGKPLTLFEHFKAELEREMRILDEKNGTKAADRMIAKIDREWTDLLWNYRNGCSGDADDNIIDDEFLRYFKFICDIICYRNGKTPHSNDVFDLLHLYFSAQSENAMANIETLESFFDCWCNIRGYNSPTSFLASFMSYNHEKGKIVVDAKDKIDIFEDCIHSYSDKSGKLRHFPLNRIVLLYAITVYLQHQEEVAYADFVRRIRIVNNLIQNSEDEISDRVDRNRMPAIIQAVDGIILTGAMDSSAENNFNVSQIQEEQAKIILLSEHPEHEAALFALEDHHMLSGQVSIVGLENLALAERFTSLFTCSWDKIDCAMMTVGNYSQQERNEWRYQFASKNRKSAWHDLFHMSANKGYEHTKSVLVQLLNTNKAFDNTVLDGIILDYIAKCEGEETYPWNYYYIKYSDFRPGSYGKMSNNDVATKPYLFSVMQTRTQWSTNTYMPYLKAVEGIGGAVLDRDSLGQKLIHGDTYICCKNDSYDVYKKEDGHIVATIKISQNSDGFDTEDRIAVLKKYLEK